MSIRSHHRALSARCQLERLEERSAPSSLDWLGAEDTGLHRLFASPWDLSGQGSALTASHLLIPSQRESTPIQNAILGNFSEQNHTAFAGVTGAVLAAPLGADDRAAQLREVVASDALQPTPGDGGGPEVQADSPVISNFRYTVLPGGTTYIFQGTVTGEGVVGQPVIFGGLPTLAGPPPKVAYVVIGNLGAQEFTLEVNLAVGEVGLALAIVQNQQGMYSNTAEVYVGE